MSGIKDLDGGESGKYGLPKIFMVTARWSSGVELDSFGFLAKEKASISSGERMKVTAYSKLYCARGPILSGNVSLAAFAVNP